MSRDESQEGREGIQAENSVGQDEQLLPGIPNVITLDLIAPKLPWTAFHILASVSRGWQRAIRRRQVYDSRVRSKLTQTLVAMDFDDIALYSMEDGACWDLPGIPDPGIRLPSGLEGIPQSCAWIPLEGKLYVLGGLKDERVSSDVYVFDVAGQRPWKQCASMGDARSQFGCGVKDGKIYVFGGTSGSEIVCRSEVYDPEQDAWSPITPCPSFRLNHKVTTVGEEFFLHNGDLHDSNLPSSSHKLDALSAEVYHPQKDEWRIVEHFIHQRDEILLIVGGKLHRLNGNSIEVYDVNANSWSHSKQLSFGVSEPKHGYIESVHAAVGVDDGVMALVHWRIPPAEEGEEDDGDEEPDSWRVCPIRFQWKSGESTEITWQRLECSILFVDGYYPGLCPIQL